MREKTRTRSDKVQRFHSRRRVRATNEPRAFIRQSQEGRMRRRLLPSISTATTVAVVARRRNPDSHDDDGQGANDRDEDGASADDTVG
jgi:hypothetical protein